MSDTNRYIAQDAAVLTNPIAYTPLTETADVLGYTQAEVFANIDLLMEAVAKEGTDPTDHRLFLDEMSPAARNSLYCMLQGLRDSFGDA